jgi:hypothetical protein
VDHIHKFIAQKIGMQQGRLVRASLEGFILSLSRPGFGFHPYGGTTSPESIQEVSGTVREVLDIGVKVSG